jgi:hypothetical protein
MVLSGLDISLGPVAKSEKFHSNSSGAPVMYAAPQALPSNDLKELERTT